MSIYKSEYRVYYEDTDAEGIVYYANYLKFTERGRTDLLRDRGISHIELLEKHGICFVAKKCEIEYHAPAILSDLITVKTSVVKMGNSSLTMKQDIYNSATGKLLAESQIVLVCVTMADKKPARIPQTVRELLE